MDGTYDTAEWACAGSADFTANLSGGDTPATVHWMNDGTNLYMAVRVFQSSFEKANSLLIDFDNDGDGFVAENDDAIGYDPKDIAVGTGDTLGFFLTLRVGKGAQGNTQWPGFRSFRNITVVGF